MSNIYQYLKTQLKQGGIDLPELEARILLREFAHVTDADILTNNIPAFDETKLNEALARRISGEPMGRILGYREFYGRKFYLSPATLEPRPDTETLIEAVLAEDRKPKTILDLGTGTGCILLTLLHEIPDARGVGIDISLEACETARRNAREQGVDHRVSFINGDWAESLNTKFDIIVSNPPYIPSETILNLDSNVRDFDPMAALDGGNDGLDPYRNLLETLKKLLGDNGVIFFELGKGQVPDIEEIAVTYGATLRSVYTDLGGVERVVKISFGDNSEKP